MHGGGRILVTVLILVLFAPPADASPWQVCGKSGTYTADSAYQANLNRMADTLPANTSSSPTLFATATVGAGPNQTVYALALCRGDLDASSCLLCVNSGFKDGQLLCDSDMDVTMYYDACHVRFSNRNFLASTNNSQQQAFFSSSPSLASSVAARFQTFVTKLLNATADYAVANSTRKFATGEMDVDRDYFGGQFDKISSLAQWTPDLTPAQCRACLAAAMSEMPHRVFPRNPRGARVVGERCGLRFDVFPFYDGNPMVRLQVGGPRGKTKATPVLVIILAILGGLVAIALIGLFVWRKKWSQRKASLFTNVEDMGKFESIFIGLSTLQSATSNFDEKNKLGEGGFGAVYKGALPDGQEVAVKRLCQISKQGVGQMKNELALIAKLQHKNLVRLVGVCLEGGEHLLVYEYMPNKA